jgi:hypothetical protein
MSSSDRLLLILHVGFVIFTLGPLTAATSATPRYIRRRNVAVLRYLTRATRIYGVASLGIALFGLLLAGGELAEFWLSASVTLFVVALVLLVLIERDQRRAAHILEVAAAEQGALARPAGTAPAVAADAEGAEAAEAKAVTEPAAERAPEPAADGDTDSDADEPRRKEPKEPLDDEIARVERGRIASFSGVVALIWLVILFLMVWYSRG